MADIGGFIVGVLSLGIQVSQGLISYYNDFKGQHEEIDDLSNKLVALRNTLLVLERLANSEALPESESSELVRSSVIATFGGIARLQTALKKCRQNITQGNATNSSGGNQASLQGPDPTSYTQPIKNLYNKIAYPFKKGTLLSLKSDVADLQNNLNVAIHALQLENNKTVIENTSNIKRAVASLSIQTTQIDEQIRHLSAHLIRISEVLPTIQLDVRQIESSIHGSLPPLQSSICSIARDMPALRSKLMLKAELHEAARLGSSIDNDPAIDGIVADVECLKSNLLKQPSLLRDALDHHRQGSLSSEVGFRKTPTSPFRSWCSCQPSVDRDSTTKYLWNAIFFTRSTQISAHAPNCPLSKKYTGSQARSFGVNFLICNYFLKGILAVSMTAVKGAGAWSISPKLNFRATVEDSEAFEILRNLEDDTWIGESGVEQPVLCQPGRIQAAIRALQEAFVGKASPTDMTAQGENIVYVACSIWRKNIIIRDLPRPWADPECEKTAQKFRTLLNEYRQLVQYLCGAIKAVGVSVNETNVFGHSPLSIIIDELILNSGCYSDCVEFGNTLIEEGAVIGEEFFRESRGIERHGEDNIYYHNHPEINLAQYLKMSKMAVSSIEATSDLSLGPLSNAVIARNLTDVQEILGSAAWTDVGIDLTGQSPLHYAVGWPAGVAVLADSIPHLVNLPNRVGECPIHYACYKGYHESVAILLDHDCHLDRSENFEQVLIYAVKSGDFKTIDLLIDALASRRLRLRALADIYLPPDTLATFKRDRVPDADAYSIVTELQSRGIPIPDAIHPYSVWPGSPTIYHELYSICRPYLPVVAQKLYNAGFLDIDQADENGRTPLAKGPPRPKIFTGEDDAKLAYWLIQKGHENSTSPDTRRISKSTGAVAMHFLAERIGWALVKAMESKNRMLNDLEEPNSDLSNVLTMIAVSPERDCCSCPCTPKGWGCTPMALLLRRIRGRTRDEYSQPRLLFLLSWLSPRLSQIQTELKCEHPETELSQFRWQIVAPIVSFLTFESLSLSHTCCILDNQESCNPLSPGPAIRRRSRRDVTAISEDQINAPELMDAFNQGFEKIMAKVDEPLYTLLECYWAPPIRAFLEDEHDEVEEYPNESVVPEAESTGSEHGVEGNYRQPSAADEQADIILHAEHELPASAVEEESQPEESLEDESSQSSGTDEEVLFEKGLWPAELFELFRPFQEATTTTDEEPEVEQELTTN